MTRAANMTHLPVLSNVNPCTQNKMYTFPPREDRADQHLALRKLVQILLVPAPFKEARSIPTVHTQLSFFLSFDVLHLERSLHLELQITLVFIIHRRPPSQTLSQSQPQSQITKYSRSRITIYHQAITTNQHAPPFQRLFYHGRRCLLLHLPPIYGSRCYSDGLQCCHMTALGGIHPLDIIIRKE
jgi:hypothetical protein